MARNVLSAGGIETRGGLEDYSGSRLRQPNRFPRRFRRDFARHKSLRGYHNQHQRIPDHLDCGSARIVGFVPPLEMERGFLVACQNAHSYGRTPVGCQNLEMQVFGSDRNDVAISVRRQRINPQDQAHRHVVHQELANPRPPKSVGCSCDRSVQTRTEFQRWHFTILVRQSPHHFIFVVVQILDNYELGFDRSTRGILNSESDRY